MRRDHHTSTVSGAAMWEDLRTHRPSRHELAHDAGYEPHRDDLVPAQPLAADDPWQVALEASFAEVARIKEQQR